MSRYLLLFFFLINSSSIYSQCFDSLFLYQNESLVHLDSSINLAKFRLYMDIHNLNGLISYNYNSDNFPIKGVDISTQRESLEKIIYNDSLNLIVYQKQYDLLKDCLILHYLDSLKNEHLLIEKNCEDSLGFYCKKVRKQLKNNIKNELFKINPILSPDQMKENIRFMNYIENYNRDVCKDIIEDLLKYFEEGIKLIGVTFIRNIREIIIGGVILGISLIFKVILRLFGLDDFFKE